MDGKKGLKYDVIMCIMEEWFSMDHTSVRSFWMKSLGRIPTDPVPHSLVRDCCSCRSKFSLSVVDLDNSFSTSKAVICSRLSISLEAISKKKGKKHRNNDVLKEDNFNCKTTDHKF